MPLSIRPVLSRWLVCQFDARATVHDSLNVTTSCFAILRMNFKTLIFPIRFLTSREHPWSVVKAFQVVLEDFAPILMTVSIANIQPRLACFESAESETSTKKRLRITKKLITICSRAE